MSSKSHIRQYNIEPGQRNKFKVINRKKAKENFRAWYKTNPDQANLFVHDDETKLDAEEEAD